MEEKEMVDRKKKTKGSQGKEDMISKLPDSLISDKILTHLSIKDAVRTSVLSRKWGNLWQSAPVLDIDSGEFSNIDAFVNFLDRFFDSDSYKESWIREFKLIHRNSDDGDGTQSHLSSWIDAVTKRKIQQLDVVCFGNTTALFSLIPMSLYTCETLVQLRLSWVTLVNASELVSLPCLKILYLYCVKYLNEATTLEKLISGSPVLEDLTIMETPGSKEKLIQIRSQTVKSIHIGAINEFVIDAPLLHSLKTYNFNRKKFKIIGSGFPAKIDIVVVCTVFDKPAVSEILTDISKVRELVINGDMWKGIFQYSKSEKLLQFPYLSRLDARYCQSDLELLPTLLESCPNLESLILEDKVFMGHTAEKEPNVMFSTMPQCLVSSLKFVELKIWISDHDGKMELVRYFLKNSTILETLRFHNCDTTKEKHDILEEILAMPRCSSACEILVL